MSQITSIREAFEIHVPRFPLESEGDWAQILNQAGVDQPPADSSRLMRIRTRPVLALALALVIVAAAVGVTLAATLGTFGNWLTGTPGTPAPVADQAAFQAANAHFYAAFPKQTTLNRLITRRFEGASYQLDGFRSGDELCLRLASAEIDEGSLLSCVPRIALTRAKAPAQVAMIDFPVGSKPLGHGRFSSPTAAVTFGFTADSIRSLALTDKSGRRTQAAVSHDAFLAVRSHPSSGSRTRQIAATDKQGRTVSVPFAPVLFGASGIRVVNPNVPQPGPSRVQRHVKPGTIGWLIHERPQGSSLATAGIPVSRLYGAHSFGVRFARVIQPDPNSNVRIVVYTIGKRHNICMEIDTAAGGGGGCSIHFNTPLNGSLEGANGGDQFALLAGLASDDVARIDLYLSDGERWPVALKDNTFAVQAPRDHFPATLVAYDNHGRIIGINP